MEMERINDNLIKVLIGSEDLEERGIDFLDLIGDQSRIEKFFYSILEEVDVDRHFHDSEAVTFQVIPNSEGLELYISRANVEDLDEVWEDELTRRLKERKEMLQRDPDTSASSTESDADSKKEREKDSTDKDSAINTILNLFNAEYAPTMDEESDTYTEEVVRFANLDDFIRFAREVKDSGVESDVFYLNNAYFLVLYDLEKTLVNTEEAHKLLSLYEYGETVPVTSSVLYEHGQLLHKVDALAFFGKQF